MLTPPHPPRYLSRVPDNSLRPSSRANLPDRLARALERLGLGHVRVSLEEIEAERARRGMRPDLRLGVAAPRPVVDGPAVPVLEESAEDVARRFEARRNRRRILEAAGESFSDYDPHPFRPRARRGLDDLDRALFAVRRGAAA